MEIEKEAANLVGFLWADSSSGGGVVELLRGN